MCSSVNFRWWKIFTKSPEIIFEWLRVHQLKFPIPTAWVFTNLKSSNSDPLKTKILDRFQKLRVLPNRLYVSFNSSKNILTFLIFYIWIVRKKYFYDDFISGRRGGLKETHFKSKNASGQRRNSSWTNDRIRNNFNPKKFLRTQTFDLNNK